MQVKRNKENKSSGVYENLERKSYLGREVVKRVGGKKKSLSMKGRRNRERVLPFVFSHLSIPQQGINNAYPLIMHCFHCL